MPCIRDRIVTVHLTKSGKVRRVPLPPELMKEVRTRVGRLVAFCSPGQFNTRVRIHSQVWRFHVHQLRHTFPCRWIERGGSLAALQQLLGHSSIVTTQRYVRLMDEAVFAEATFGTNCSKRRHSTTVCKRERTKSRHLARRSSKPCCRR